MNPGKNNIKWALFVSGWGRGANTCMQLFTSGALGNSTISIIVTAGQDTPLLKIARENNIRLITDNPLDYPDFDTYQTQLAKKLLNENIDYIFLLGYKYRIRAGLLKAFPSRILNIHPSLLPAFRNTASAIQDAMRYGVKISGVTTHIIDEQIDEGVILCQKAIEFKKEDNFESLDAKFMEKGADITLETFDLINKNHTPGKYLREYLETV